MGDRAGSLYTRGSTRNPARLYYRSTSISLPKYLSDFRYNSLICTNSLESYYGVESVPGVRISTRTCPDWDYTVPTDA